jgi:hypothetical protein
MSVTLLQLKNRARQRADMETSDFIEDSELVGYINASLAELYDLMVAAYGEDYFLDNYTFSTVASQADYSLPADFYKLKGVDARINGSDWYSIRPFNFNERNRNQDVTWGLIGGPNVRYRIVGSNIKFSPLPEGIYPMQLWYVPLAPTMAADGDTFDDLNQYGEYVVIDAAIKMLQKEESDVSVLMAQKQAMKRRLEEMSLNRDAGQPESISDIYSENNEFWFWRS